MRLGIERTEIIEERLKGKRVGLITNHTGVDSSFRSSIEILKSACELVTLFAPEHGVRGDLQAGVKLESYVDEETGIRVHSLYGTHRKPSKEMLEGIDVIAYDIQDVGARFYTYIYTMAYAMEAAKEHDLEFMVFDRPNPLGGQLIEGHVLDINYRSFVGYYPLIERYGLTIGELARMFNEQFDIGCKLQVIPMDGWVRSMWFEDTLLPWVPPSPNIPTPDTALHYLATCYFEGTNLSEGRGTTRPFTCFGAPWFNQTKMLEALAREALPGVLFRPTFFTPTFSKHQGEWCQGLDMHVTDKLRFRPVLTGYTLLNLCREMHDEFTFNPPYKEGMHPMIDLLTGNCLLRTNQLSDDIKEKLDKDTDAFQALKARFHLYGDD